MITPTTLREVPYLRHLEDNSLVSLAKDCHEQHFNAGELILSEGTPPKGLYLVVQGRVKIFKVSPEGREQILRVMGPGETFNDVPALDGGVNPASAGALDSTDLVILSQPTLESLLHEHPQVAWQMLGIFAGRLRAFVDLVAELSLLNVESRVAKFLIVSSQNTDRDQFHITQQDLAATVGTTREVAARALRSLEDRGAIQRTGGRIEVRNLRALTMVVEGNNV